MSAAWVQGTATGLLFLLAAWWILALLARTWRRLLWEQGGERLDALARALGHPVQPSGPGWRVRAPQGEVRVRAGVLGVRTRLSRPDGTRRVIQGWAEPAEILAWLDGG